MILWEACLFALLLIGLAIRISSEVMESRFVFLADSFFSHEEENPHDRRTVATLIERTRMVISALKLTRISSLIFIIPSFVLLMAHGWDMILPEDGGPLVRVLTDLSILIALAAILFATTLSSILTGSKQARPELGFEPPEWLIDEKRAVPTLVVAGWLAWERGVQSVDRFLKPFDLSRPPAHLFEEDGEIHLEVETVAAVEEDTRKNNGNGSPNEERSEVDMIRAIQRLDDTLVREVMRPINQVTAIRLKDYDVPSLLSLARRTGFTRIPCYEDQITNLRGYINIYDILEEGEDNVGSLRELITEPLFVPEVARVDRLLNEMITRKQQTAIVFDEFGGTSGWVTREDILEEIVGEIEDEYDKPRRKLRPTGSGYLVDPAVDLDDLLDEIGIDLPKRNCDTIAGYVYNRLGRSPHRGETLEAGDWIIEVTAVVNHRIRRIKISPIPQDESEQRDD
ncbi:MAG: transporter associated domain-containing protein [Sumerlaeia bacterium]